MNNKEVRQRDILDLIEGLDIPLSLYKNAVEKYENITRFLKGHDIDADMYPQGSFALGTVTRPYSKNDDKNYDLDFICQVKGSRDETTPSELRNTILDAINSSDLYGGKLIEYDECFTIQYAAVNNVSFSIDIVPAINENDENKEELCSLSNSPQLIKTAVAIPRYSQQKVYNWITNNPKGYKAWFDEINEPFQLISREIYRDKLFKSQRNIYASVEEIPEAMDRSSMQRVIQILKYHRDVYYSKIKHGDELKPISAIINTVVAEISKSASPHLSVFELLQYVLDEFNIYANYQKMPYTQFSEQFKGHKVFTKKNGEWRIENPANPKDNLANKWNTNIEIPKIFFQWVIVVKDELISSLNLDDKEFRMKIEMAFGYNAVSNAWGSNYRGEEPKPISTNNPVKPWRR